MIYKSAYRIPDTDDKGLASKDEYLLVNSVGFYGFDDPWGATNRKRGRFDFYLSYNHDGIMKVLSGNNICEIGPGTVFIYRPNEEQYYGQANNIAIANYWVHFTGYGATEMLIKSNLTQGNIFIIGVNDELTDLFDKMMNEIADKSHNFEIFSASILMQIFSIISRKLASNNSIVHMNERDLLINSTVSFIHKNFANEIKVSTLANMACLSPNRYSDVFKKITGLSPKQYLISLRLQKAKELMTNTSLSIKQISSLVGITDQLYFSKLFKLYEKISPSEFIIQRNSNHKY